MTAPASTRAAKAKRRLPILEGILPFDPARLPSELIAGATLAALAMPEVMGYSKIAEMPVYTGLYTLVLPMAAFALFGSSRHLVVGADSATAAVMATGLAGIAAAGAPGSSQWVAMAGLAALMCAVFMIVARLIRLGFIANFLSHSVLIGFLTGVGIQVAMGQVAGMFGVSDGSGTTLREVREHAPERSPPATRAIATLAVSVAVLATIVGLERVNKKIPGALIAVVGAIAASYLFDFAAHGITTIGTVPARTAADRPAGHPGRPACRATSTALLPVVFSMFILILAQSAATSRAYAMKYDDSFDENVDLIGLGLGNLAAGISGTFVVNGSPTKTEMVDSAGGRSQIAQLTTAAIVVVVLLFLTGPLSYMPNAVLSAVVFLIGIKLVDYLGMGGIYRLRPRRVRGRRDHGGRRRHRRRGAGDHPGHRPVGRRRPDARLQARTTGSSRSRPTASPASGRSPRPPRPNPGWSSTPSGRSCSTRTRAASARRSWRSSRRPTRP